MRDRVRRLLRRARPPGRIESLAPLPDGADHPTVRLLFDAEHYGRVGPPDAALADYVRRGWGLGLDPHPLFATTWYLERNTDVADAGVCPLVHYARFGAAEGRRPHPLFDPAYYRDRYVDISDPSIDPLAHYLTFGALEGRDPNPWFDAAYYRATNPDVAAAHVNPLVHYATAGWRAGRNPHPDFDVAFYRASNPDLGGQEPLTHFLAAGLRAGREPRADFALRRLRRRDDVGQERCRLVVVGDAPQATGGCPLIAVSSAAGYQPRAGDYVHTPDVPAARLSPADLAEVVACLANRRYNFAVMARDDAHGSRVAVDSVAGAVVVAADGYARRLAGRPLRAGSVGRVVRLPRRSPAATRSVVLDDLGLGELIRFGDDLVVAGAGPVLPPVVAHRRSPVPLALRPTPT